MSALAAVRAVTRRQEALAWAGVLPEGSVIATNT